MADTEILTTDKVTTSQTVSMTAEFGDGSTKTLSQSNPLIGDSELVTKINNLSTVMKNNAVLISDSGSAFSRIKAAKRINKVTINYDI